MNINLCLKILNAAQIHQTDQHTIAHEPIASVDLMERAATCFVHAFREHYTMDEPVRVFCGRGNNGGDGLAIARLLLDAGYGVEVCLLGEEDQGTPDFLLNLQRLKGMLDPICIRRKMDLPPIAEGEIIVDALFGSGLSRPIEGMYAACIEAINENAAHVVAVDIASGLGCDQCYDEGSVMLVRHTITFQSPKLMQLLPENDPHVGHLEVVDIGLDAKFIATIPSTYYLMTQPFVRSMFQPRKKFAHKGDAGRAMIVAGSYGMMGAAVLAAGACLRTGVGLLTMCLPRCGVNIMQTSVPEAMVRPTAGDWIEGFIDLEGFDVVGVGPGIGTEQQTADCLKLLIGSSKVPLVLDADALNILSQHPTWLEYLPKGSVLTPHPGEFRRLVGEWDSDIHKLQLLVEFAERYEVNVLLKGAHTAVANPSGQLFFNSTGNPGMATGGSGDVLTGMVTSLMAQKYSGLEAALMACYLHGLAGDLYAHQWNEQSLIASDLVDCIPGAYLEMGI
ncbi:hypothetical protein BFP72_14150 [Reichenbachiella sp. 5M10]|uniref:NAD(P)H-hydrate dehydratase n=1 Tax=Reichenbachiella sp. 5M10 TaxID=1889772 RepID=UPI000C158618|nr:NAD(P)H-hydrate dehydratase [Reichenbachiella sp. 5M10]PIB36456.1 hypothetical protein BFP72_14150 [Reichenbachiella sp. 5M10]